MASVKICGKSDAGKKEAAVSDRGYNYSCQFVVRPGRMVLFALVVSVLASVQGAELLNADFEVLKSHADRHLELHGNGQSYDSICTSVA